MHLFNRALTHISNKPITWQQLDAFKPETHCMISGCPRWKIVIVKSIVVISVTVALNRWSCVVQWEREVQRQAVVTVLRPKIAYDTVWTSHSVFAATTHVYWPTNKNRALNQRDMVLKHKTGSEMKTGKGAKRWEHFADRGHMLHSEFILKTFALHAHLSLL